MRTKKNPEQKNPVGRPSDYKPEYCQQVIDNAKEGKFLFEFANKIEKNESTLYEWANEHEEFSKAIDLAKQICKGEWVNVGRKLISDPSAKHDAKPWGVIMNNLHGWDRTAKVEVSGKDGGPINVSSEVELKGPAVKSLERIADALADSDRLDGEE